MSSLSILNRGVWATEGFLFSIPLFFYQTKEGHILEI